jgi:transposase
MRRHPGIEIVSRDRASLYSEAAGKALPHAVQVADPRHLLRNLSEALTNSLAAHHSLLNAAAQALQPGLPFLSAEENSDSPVRR